MARTESPDGNLAAVLRELRKAQDRSQEAVAHDAGLTLAAFGRIERGQADPGWTSVVRIADVLGVSLGDLGRQFDERRARRRRPQPSGGRRGPARLGRRVQDV